MESMETVGNVTDTLPREDFGSARPCEVAAPHWPASGGQSRLCTLTFTATFKHRARSMATGLGGGVANESDRR